MSSQVDAILQAFDGLITKEYLEPPDSPEALTRPQTQEDLSANLIQLELESYSTHRQEGGDHLGTRISELKTVSEALEAKIRNEVCCHSADFFETANEVNIRHNDIINVKNHAANLRVDLDLAMDQVETAARILETRENRRRIADLIEHLRSTQLLAQHLSNAAAARRAGEAGQALEGISMILGPASADVFYGFASFQTLFDAAKLQLTLLPGMIVRHQLNEPLQTLNNCRECISLLWTTHILTSKQSRRSPSLEALTTTLCDCVLGYIRAEILQRLNKIDLIDEDIQMIADSKVGDAVQCESHLLGMLTAFDVASTALNSFSFLYLVVVASARSEHSLDTASLLDFKELHNYLSRESRNSRDPDSLRGIVGPMSGLVMRISALLATIVRRLPMPASVTPSLSNHDIEITALASAILMLSLRTSIARILPAEEASNEVDDPNDLLGTFRLAIDRRFLDMFVLVRREALQELSDYLSQEKWTRAITGKLSPPPFPMALSTTLIDLCQNRAVKKLMNLTSGEKRVSVYGPDLERWILKAESVADVLKTSGLEGSDNSPAPPYNNLFYRAAKIVRENLQGMTMLGSSIEEEFVKSCSEIWDFLVYSTLSSLLCPKIFDQVLTSTDLASPSRDCVGGPALETAHTLFLKQRSVFDVRIFLHHLRNRRFLHKSTYLKFPPNWEPSPPPEARGTACSSQATVELIVAAESITHFANILLTHVAEPVLKQISTSTKCKLLKATLKSFIKDLNCAKHISFCLYESAATGFVDIDQSWGSPMTGIVKSGQLESPDIEKHMLNLSREIDLAKRSLAVISGGSLPPESIAELFQCVHNVAAEIAVSVLASAEGGSKHLSQTALDSLGKIFAEYWALINSLLPIDKETEPNVFELYWQAHHLPANEVMQWCKKQTKLIHSKALVALLYHTDPKRAEAKRKAADLQIWLCEYIHYVKDQERQLKR